MLVIYRPDNADRRKRRHRRQARALAYFVALVITMTALCSAFGHGWLRMTAAVAVESWLMWAVITDPGLEK